MEAEPMAAALAPCGLEVNPAVSGGWPVPPGYAMFEQICSLAPESPGCLPSAFVGIEHSDDFLCPPPAATG